VSTIVELLGMDPLDGTGAVDGGSSHTLLLAGMVLEKGRGEKCLVRVRMAVDGGGGGVSMEIRARGGCGVVNERVANCIT
jgi:hypothetical protein